MDVNIDVHSPFTLVTRCSECNNISTTVMAVDDLVFNRIRYAYALREGIPYCFDCHTIKEAHNDNVHS